MLLTKVSTWEQTDRAPDDAARNLVFSQAEGNGVAKSYKFIIMLKMNKMWDIESQLDHQLISALLVKSN